jgi:hypothetical protein
MNRNTPSGGHASDIEIGAFLTHGPLNPENQALLRLIATLVDGGAENPPPRPRRRHSDASFSACGRRPKARRERRPRNRRSIRDVCGGGPAGTRRSRGSAWGDELAAQTWRDIADAAERILRESAGNRRPDSEMYATIVRHRGHVAVPERGMRANPKSSCLLQICRMTRTKNISRMRSQTI